LLAVLTALANSEGSDSYPCIVDVDIDYFTRRDGDHGYKSCVSETFVRQLGEVILRGMVSRHFPVVTVALSPSTTGSWELAEQFLASMFGSLPELDEFFSAAP
jgi:hypothetical protein